MEGEENQQHAAGLGMQRRCTELAGNAGAADDG